MAKPLGNSPFLDADRGTPEDARNRGINKLDEAASMMGGGQPAVIQREEKRSKVGQQCIRNLQGGLWVKKKILVSKDRAAQPLEIFWQSFLIRAAVS